MHRAEVLPHERAASLPRDLARLEYGIFERLDLDPAREWPELFISSIKPGADLSKTCGLFLAWLLDDREQGLIRFAEEMSRTTFGKRARELLARIARLYREDCPDEVQWRDAKRALSEAFDTFNKRESLVWSIPLPISGLVGYSSALHLALAAALAAVDSRNHPSRIFDVLKTARDAECRGGFDGEIVTQVHEIWSKKLLLLLRDTPVADERDAFGGSSAGLM